MFNVGHSRFLGLGGTCIDMNCPFRHCGHHVGMSSFAHCALPPCIRHRYIRRRRDRTAKYNACCQSSWLTGRLHDRLHDRLPGRPLGRATWSATRPATRSTMMPGRLPGWLPGRLRQIDRQTDRWKVAERPQMCPKLAKNTPSQNDPQNSTFRSARGSDSCYIGYQQLHFH